MSQRGRQIPLRYPSVQPRTNHVCTFPYLARLRLPAFDVLWMDGTDLRSLRLIARARRLKAASRRLSSQVLYVDHVVGDGWLVTPRRTPSDCEEEDDVNAERSVKDQALQVIERLMFTGRLTRQGPCSYREPLTSETSIRKTIVRTSAGRHFCIGAAVLHVAGGRFLPSSK